MAINYGGVGAGALSGAATGSVAGPYGAAAGAVIGGGLSLLGGDNGAAYQQQIEANNLQNSQNQQQYAHALNAEAMKRASAGSVDAQGNTIRYDPGSNSWVSTLGAEPTRQQGAVDSANYLHNQVAVPQAIQNNAASSIQASLARRGMSGALNDLNNAPKTNVASLEGALQGATTRANQVSEAPIIADTLRQFARTGTAAGPVLAQLERASGDTLSQEMSRNTIDAMKGASDIDASRKQALSIPIQTLQQAGTPFQQDTTASYTPGPAAGIAAQVNGRATGSATPAQMGSAYSAYGTAANTQASAGASGVAMNSPVPGELASANQSIQTLGRSGIGQQINDYFNGPKSSQAPDGSIYGPIDPNAKASGTNMNAFFGNGKIPNDPNVQVSPSY